MKTFIALLLIALAIGLASCSSGPHAAGGPSTGTGGSGGAPQQAPPMQSANATNAQGGPNAGKTQVAPGISVNESNYKAHGNYTPDQLTRLAFAQILTHPKPYHVTLVGQRTIGGVTTTSVQNWYLDGSDLRYDSGNQHAIKLGNRTFVCTNESGWSCTEQPFQFYTGIEADIRNNPLAYPVKKLSVSPIGGTTTSCYEVDHNGTANATFCLTDSGIPTMIDIEAADGTASKFVASGYSTKVPSGVFTLPALPKS